MLGSLIGHRPARSVSTFRGIKVADSAGPNAKDEFTTSHCGVGLIDQLTRVVSRQECGSR
jgi:hypothetical protein